MEDNNLFDNFDSDSSEQEKSKAKNYVGNKHPRDDSDSDNEIEKKKSNKVKIHQSITDSNNVTKINDNVMTEEESDILLEKNVERLVPEYNSETKGEELLDPTMRMTTYQFPGGFHETVCTVDFKGDYTLHNPTKPPAYKYSFELDHFQKRAILCLENHQSVLVSAHTSAGKTVVAQYAIAMAFRDKQRVIYTSPIKALSNQKYRELSHAFGDVGLMTGDVTLKPNATCIVMTTEILRNMLYKGSEITREMAWVIFDEVHYMRDKERGVVWEETIILLSNKINYVFLSATIPNAREFAMWISEIKCQPCNVVYTDFRPVPLQHYIYPEGGEGIYLIVDKNGNFKDENFSSSLEVLHESQNLEKIFEKNKGGKSIKKDPKKSIRKIIKLIKENNLSPAIVFSFSKKDCEDKALALAKDDLTTEDEKNLIEEVFMNAIKTLSEEDQNLQQIQMMLPILKKGVGIHHGGMLPILKECVELIFQEGFLKILFSTETFSMGINMPAKTVVFTSVDKWDGTDRRYLTGGEYIQMSGRAGRRGIDDQGITIMMIEKAIDESVIKGMLQGKADVLKSAFCLNYNQLVNLFRMEDTESEYIVKRSFRQFQHERNIPKMKKELSLLFKEYKEKYKFTEKGKEEDLKKYIDVEIQIEDIEEKIRKLILQNNYFEPFIVFGRMIKLKNFGVGIVINKKKQGLKIIKKKKKRETKVPGNEEEEEDKSVEAHVEENSESSEGENKDSEKESEEEDLVIDILVYVHSYTDPNLKVLPGDLEKGDGRMGVVSFISSAIEYVSPVKIKLPKNMKEKSSLQLAEKLLKEAMKRFNGVLPEMDPIKEMGINDEELKDNIEKKKKLNEIKSDLEKKMIEKYGKIIIEEEVDLFKEKKEKKKQMNKLIKKIDSSRELVLEDQLGNMKRVLRRLGLINQDVVTEKGQVACNISSADELLLTEMLFNGSFNEIPKEVLAAVLTCFLSNERGGGETKIPLRALEPYYQKIKEEAEKIYEVLEECKIEVEKDKYIESFRSDYMIPVYEWANGKTFEDITKLDENLYEGSIIRVIRRLDELIKQLVDCAVIIGNTKLKTKLEETSEVIRRGIPFAASLYLAC